ncbi:MAG: hypothetical protein LBV22_03190 [Mycoplasmataceae bacterium]|nr:hypothetical protein [Mycoplasmataceae bacterium]
MFFSFWFVGAFDQGMMMRLAHFPLNYFLLIAFFINLHQAIDFIYVWARFNNQNTYLQPVLSSTRTQLPTKLRQLFLDKKIDSIDYILFYYWYVVRWYDETKPTILFQTFTEQNKHEPGKLSDIPVSTVWLSDIKLRITKNSHIKPCNMENYYDYASKLEGIDCEGHTTNLSGTLSSTTKLIIKITRIIYIILFLAIVITYIWFNWMYETPLRHILPGADII